MHVTQRKKMVNTTTFISDNDKQQQLAEYRIDVCCFCCVTVRLVARCCVVELLTRRPTWSISDISNFESIISAIKTNCKLNESANRSSKWDDVYKLFWCFLRVTLNSQFMMCSNSEMTASKHQDNCQMCCVISTCTKLYAYNDDMSFIENFSTSWCTRLNTISIFTCWDGRESVESKPKHISTTHIQTMLSKSLWTAVLSVTTLHMSENRTSLWCICYFPDLTIYTFPYKPNHFQKYSHHNVIILCNAHVWITIQHFWHELRRIHQHSYTHTEIIITDFG